jgi:hypothetical protein
MAAAAAAPRFADPRAVFAEDPAVGVVEGHLLASVLAAASTFSASASSASACFLKYSSLRTVAAAAAANPDHEERAIYTTIHDVGWRAVGWPALHLVEFCIFSQRTHRVAPTALPRSSIIVSDEPLSRETNYRTEFVAVLNNQPQGGFLMRRPTVDVPVASGNNWGNDDFGFNWNSQPANTRSRTGQYYQATALEVVRRGTPRRPHRRSGSNLEELTLSTTRCVVPPSFRPSYGRRRWGTE